MPFRRESEMLEPARRWLESLGYRTKSEFETPWGICDLVGCQLNEERVSERLRHGQRDPIGPAFRIALLLQIPEVATRKSIRISGLQRQFCDFIDPKDVADEVDRLVSGKFVHVTKSGAFQKVNGWMPLHRKIVTVELKLSRFSEAVRQATANKRLTADSYVALPRPLAERALRSNAESTLVREGIGLVALEEDSWEILRVPSPHQEDVDLVAQVHCGERFWRTFLKGN